MITKQKRKKGNYRMTLSTPVVKLLRRVGSLFVAGGIRVEKGRLATATGSLTTYLDRLRGEIPASTEPAIWFATTIGPMVRYQNGEIQAWQPDLLELRRVLLEIDGDVTKLENAKRLVSSILFDADRDRVLLFLLICFSKNAGHFAGPILEAATMEQFVLPYVVQDRLTTVFADQLLARCSTSVGEVQISA